MLYSTVYFCSISFYLSHCTINAQKTLDLFFKIPYFYNCFKGLLQNLRILCNFLKCVLKIFLRKLKRDYVFLSDSVLVSITESRRIGTFIFLIVF